MNDLNIWVQEEAGIGELMGVGGDSQVIRKRQVEERQASRGGFFCWVIPQYPSLGESAWLGFLSGGKGCGA